MNALGWLVAALIVYAIVAWLKALRNLPKTVPLGIRDTSRGRRGF